MDKFDTKFIAETAVIDTEVISKWREPIDMCTVYSPG